MDRTGKQRKIVAFLLVALFFVSFPKPAFAQLFTQLWVGTSCTVGDVATIRGVICVLINLVYTIPPLIVLASLVMIISGAAELMGAANEPKKISSAWSRITFGIIGVILIPLAWLVLIVLGVFLGRDLMNFGF